MDLSTREQKYNIALNNCQNSQVVDEKFLVEVAHRCLAHEGVSDATISIALVDNTTIRRLNREYLDHDFETDVLSFLLDMETAVPDAVGDTPKIDECNAAGDTFSTSPALVPRGSGKRIDGEIILSVEMAVQSATRYSWSPHDEATLYLVHGLLHLCGYDDTTYFERKTMRARECELLDLWKLKPAYDILNHDDSLPNQAHSKEKGVRS